MGHEAAGDIVEVGEGVDRFKLGDRVIINPILYCGKCQLCLTGKRNLCPHGGLLGRDVAKGTYAEYISVPEHLVFKFPETISYKEAALIELLVTVYHGQKRIRIAPGDSVALLGQGASGLLHTRLAKLSGAYPVIATSRSEWKLELARKYGADIIVNARKEDPVESILKYTNGQGVDIAIESAGSSEAMKQALEIVKRGGTILGFGIQLEPIDKLNLFPLYFKEITIVGCRALTGEEFEPSIKLVASGAIDVKPLITHQFTIEETKKGLELVDKSPGSVLRGVINIS
jgi:2-desacetyl-2-hydroxyethyl bacteriochlorophyllide A dehydrogenase